MPIVRPSKVAHVVYRTRRFDQMVRWYETVFQAQVQYRSPALAFLTFDEEHHRFAFVNMAVFQPNGSEEDRQGAIGVDHLGYSYPTLRDLLENYLEWKAQGIEPYWCIHHGITASLYYADPDGNQMEFQVDCLHSAAEASEFMATMFRLNPLGVEFDPREWLEQLRAGAAEETLLVRTTHEPVSPLRGALQKYLEAPV
ncbi:MAG: VOC family protein [Bryobacterales bacterium]|nr:VOC family protein [Bryobacterales bacterium]